MDDLTTDSCKRVDTCSSDSSDENDETFAESSLDNACGETEISSITIIGGVTHIGDKHTNITNTENVTLVVNNLEEKPNNPELQIIKDIQRNLERAHEHEKTSELRETCFTNILISGALAIVVIIVLFFVFLSTKDSGVIEQTDVGKFDNVSYCSGICLVQGEEWGLIEVPKEYTCSVLEALVLRATILFETCTNLEQCSFLVRGLQNRLDYLTAEPVNHPPKYNFVIGGDERIYVVRGWDCGFPKYYNTAILFNNYLYTMTDRQIYLFLLLLNVGRQCGRIEPNFEFTLKCDYNAHLYTDLVRAVNLTKDNLYYVKSYEDFLEDSTVVSHNVCSEPNYVCRNVSANPSGGLVNCDFTNS